jgi:fatty acid desaturase
VEVLLTTRRGSPVLLFPALSGAAFAAACAWPLPIVVRAVVFLLAAVALCFSVHVSVHEAVHQPALARFPLASPFFTIIMGLPLEGYRWHHLNHHRWNNRLEDYSTTWRRTASGPRPWPLWSYVLGWPRQLMRSGRAMRMAATAGELPLSRQRALRREQYTLLAWVAGLAFTRPLLALAYVTLIYVGWALIALQNYGQHPPRRYGNEAATSFGSPLYNRLLFRNGLHGEHHDQPQAPWYALQPRPQAPIHRPHLVQPFRERA